MTASGLNVRDLGVRFGGIVAVDGVSLDIPRGRLTGLVGPNGAGKTTTFNACTGLVTPSAGTVTLDGTDITALTPPARALRGLGRTFQRMELFDRLTVAENVAMGAESGLVGRRPLGAVFATRREAAAVRQRAGDALRTCGLTDVAGRLAGSLSTGQRRMVELARAVAAEFSVLLLDEPSSGLDDCETQGFASIVEELVAERGTAVLLVEHDMALVRRVCSYVYVLDFGKLIAEGPTDEVLASETVRSAYLGKEVA